ncbi:1518_t:CDS:2 [Ambispora leptoticha]|uniref:1518_t:CDS:1 n=1 Tax=Ambispora leptoticha TaxID=144679 RepID=A0A9N8WEF1_9GLOM|nr:1518_t:CDS:2 [Ambispora leptoticha]
MAPKIIVTAVDGWTGYEIVKHITTPDLVNKFGEIYATSEGPETIADVAELKQKKEVTFLEIDSSKNLSKMEEVFKKAEIAVLIPPAKTDKLQRSKNLIEACKTAGLKKVVLISMAAADVADKQKQPHIAEFQQIEHEAKQAGFDHLTIIRVNFYTENLLLYKEQMHKGKLPLPIHDGKFAPVAIKDVAEGVGALLSDCEKFHKSNEECCITLTGDKALGGSEIASCISKCTGCKLEFDNISNEEAQKILANVKGLDESEQHVLVEFYDLVKANNAAFVTDSFKNLVSHDPTSLEEFCKLHESELKSK